MMRIWKYMKIDCMRTKSYAFAFIFFPALMVVVMSFSEEPSPVFSFIYCLFVGVVFASFPFYDKNVSEIGFIKMLPGKPGDDIKGHFLYAFCVIIVSGFLGLLATFISSLLNPKIEFLEEVLMTGIFPVILGAALIFAGIEDWLMCICKSNHTRIIQLLRIVPAFIFMFGGASLMEYAAEIEQFLKLTMTNGWLTWCVCVMFFFVMAYVSCIVTERRDDL